MRLLIRVNLESFWVDLHIMITLWYLMNLRIILSKLLGIEQFSRDLLKNPCYFHGWVWHPHGIAACVGSHASKRLNPPSSISSGCRWRNSVAIPCEGTTQRAWKLEIWKVQWKYVKVYCMAKVYITKHIHVIKHWKRDTKKSSPSSVSWPANEASWQVW